MLDFILDMLTSPDAQADPYEWGAVLLAHFALGLAATAALGLATDVWKAALTASIIYVTGWELIQLLFLGASLSDFAVDSTAFVCGSFAAAAAWRNKGGIAAFCLAIMTVLGLAGLSSRLENGKQKQ